MSRPTERVHAHRNHWAASHKRWPRWIRVARLRWFRRRHTIHQNPTAWRVYRFLVAVIGGVITALGLVMVPLPGPGWLTVFIGIAILATEFHWAKRLLHRGSRMLRSWTAWLRRQHVSVRIGISILTCLFVCAIVYVILRLTGLPEWTPSWAAPPWLGISVGVE